MEQTQQVTVADLYNQLLLSESGELQADIPMEEVYKLKTSLIKHKTAQNRKLRDAGLQPDTGTLSFEIEESEKGIGRLTVRLKYPETFSLSNIVAPQADF